MNQFNKWTLVVFGVSVLSLAACGENEDTEESPTGKGPQQEETIEYEALNGVQQIPANQNVLYFCQMFISVTCKNWMLTLLQQLTMYFKVLF